MELIYVVRSVVCTVVFQGRVENAENGTPRGGCKQGFFSVGFY